MVLGLLAHSTSRSGGGSISSAAAPQAVVAPFDGQQPPLGGQHSAPLHTVTRQAGTVRSEKVASALSIEEEAKALKELDKERNLQHKERKMRKKLKKSLAAETVLQNAETGLIRKEQDALDTGNLKEIDLLEKTFRKLAAKEEVAKEKVHRKEAKMERVEEKEPTLEAGWHKMEAALDPAFEHEHQALEHKLAKSKAKDDQLKRQEVHAEKRQKRLFKNQAAIELQASGATHRLPSQDELGAEDEEDEDTASWRGNSGLKHGQHASFEVHPSGIAT